MTAESMQDSTVPVGDKSMTFEVCFRRLCSDSFAFTSVYTGATTPMAKLDPVPSSVRLGVSYRASRPFCPAFGHTSGAATRFDACPQGPESVNQQFHQFLDGEADI